MLHPIRHFLTITRHKNKVLAHCIRCGIPMRGFLHDLSKYSPEEFTAGMRYWQGIRSPNEKERELFGYSAAWMHHKGRNKHHFEYWTDVSIVTNRYEPVEMPLVYLKEMFCDRVAASKIYKGKEYTDDAALQYFLRTKVRDKMHDKTALVLEKWLRMLAEEGEEKTFSHIRQVTEKNWEDEKQ